MGRITIFPISFHPWTWYSLQLFRPFFKYLSVKVGKVFLVNKSGVIIYWGVTDCLFRISSRCVLLGTDKVFLQEMSVNSFCKIACKNNQKTIFVSSTGFVADYISSANSDMHFVLYDEEYRVVDNEGSFLWRSFMIPIL